MTLRFSKLKNSVYIIFRSFVELYSEVNFLYYDIFIYFIILYIILICFMLYSYSIQLY